ncbi:PilN domain-containing protein, partial [Vibrio parahaemolyticus]|nr:PilN domain-containing protein [Vibrio parahaemolyticus]
TARLATMLDNLERSEAIYDVEMHSIVHGKERFGKAFQTFTVSFMFGVKPQSVQAVAEANHG